MAKKKKKNNSRFNKQENARRKNEFLKEIKHAFDQLGCSDVFSLIPKSQYTLINDLRGCIIPIDKVEGQGVTKNELEQIRFVLKKIFADPKMETIDYKGTKLTINYAMTYVLPMYIYSGLLGDEKFTDAKKIKELIDERIDFNKIYADAMNKIGELLFMNATLWSHFDKYYQWYDVIQEIQINNHSCQFARIVLNRVMAVKRLLKVDGITRTIFKVGIPYAVHGITWVTLNASQFSKGAAKDKLYDVYIQSHAIRRYYERLDCLAGYILNFQLIIAFTKPKIVHLENTHLIEFKIHNYKLGYFLVELHEEIALIRTFLFITNNGTPEGQKLEQICGLKKQDKAYWNIDKLSIFKNSDIGENHELRKIFVEAGCSDIFDIDFKHVIINQKHIEQAMQIVEYMKKDEIYEPELQ